MEMETKPNCEHEDKSPAAIFSDGEDCWIWLKCANCDEDFVIRGVFPNTED